MRFAIYLVDPTSAFGILAVSFSYWVWCSLQNRSARSLMMGEITRLGGGGRGPALWWGFVKCQAFLHNPPHSVPQYECFQLRKPLSEASQTC